MKKRSLQLAWLAILLLIAGGEARLVTAAAPPTEPCGTVNFYLFNALDEAVMIDLVNSAWSNEWG